MYDYSDPGTDAGYCDSLSDGPAIATCADCGDQFRTMVAEPGARCDYCWAQRDAHTDALEAAYLLKRMAKAILTADLSNVKGWRDVRLQAQRAGTVDGRLLSTR